ncbi:MAG TPA: PEPxxWA-CTERM sorting domain-containing protein [Phenylobacterium sp.]
MKVWVGLALTAALVVSGSAAAARGTQNNLKQIGIATIQYEVDFFTPFPPVVDEATLKKAVLHVRKSGCGDDCATLEVTYFTLADGGGLQVADETGAVQFSAFGEQLFTGPTERPQFRLGEFTFDTDRNGAAIDGRLSVSEAVPEPASWALMITGFGLTGAMARRRARAISSRSWAAPEPG